MANHNAVAHAWAHRTGRQRRGFNMYYEGDTIYSYGRHFPIARLVGIAGQTVVFFTSRSYSTSTAKHKTIVRLASHHLRTFIVEDVERDDHAANYDDMIRRAAVAVDRAKRARVYGDMHLRNAQELLNDARDYAALFGLQRAPVSLESLDTCVADLVARLAAAERECRERERLAHLEQARRDRERLREWLRGADVRPPHTFRPMLRVRGDKVETTWGATVPLQVALRVYNIAKSHRPAPGDVMRIEEVGAYGAGFVDERGNIKVGCHTIPFRYAKVAACLAGLDEGRAAA